jgi:hypothetical protein
MRERPIALAVTIAIARAGMLGEAKRSTPASANAPTVCPLGNEFALPRA